MARSITLIFTLLSISIFGQHELKKAKFNLPKQNYVYVGLPAPIEVYNFKKGDSLLAPEGVGIIKGAEAGWFKIIVKKNLKDFELTVIDKKGRSKSIIELHSMLLPNPQVTFQGLRQGLISKENLLKGRSLEVEIPCSFFQVEAKVVKFSIMVMKKGPLINHSGSVLNAKARALLKSCERGDRVFIENIQVKLPNGERRKVPSIILKVK